MKKKLKDYLHLYLGSRLLFLDTADTEYSYELVAVTSISYELDDNESGIMVQLFNEEQKFKPILRPLESMTEEEMKECGNLVYDFSDDPELNTWKPSHFETGIDPEQFLWLLKRNFDLFGLIEAGLSIPSPTTTREY